MRVYSSTSPTEVFLKGNVMVPFTFVFHNLLYQIFLFYYISLVLSKHIALPTLIEQNGTLFLNYLIRQCVALVPCVPTSSRVSGPPPRSSHPSFMVCQPPPWSPSHLQCRVCLTNKYLIVPFRFAKADVLRQKELLE